MKFLVLARTRTSRTTARIRIKTRIRTSKAKTRRRKRKLSEFFLRIKSKGYQKPRVCVAFVMEYVLSIAFSQEMCYTIAYRIHALVPQQDRGSAS